VNINFLLLTYSVGLGYLISQINGADKKEKINLKRAKASSVFEICQPNLVCMFSYAQEIVKCFVWKYPT